MNRRRDAAAALEGSGWSAGRVAEALEALARQSGLPIDHSASFPAPADLPVEELGRWIEQSGERAGLHVEQVFVSLDEIGALLRAGAPALIRLAALDGAPLLAVVGRRGRYVRVLVSDGRVRRVPASAVIEAIRRPFEAAVEDDVDAVVGRLGLPPRARARARQGMIADRLKTARFRGCWVIRLSPGAPVAQSLGETGLRRRLGLLAAAYFAQYALFVLSWLILGRGILQDTVDQGWVFGWLLLLASLIPVRLIVTWQQGAAAVAAGVWLRRRLLRGASRIDRQDLRHKGAGQLFGLVIEAAALDGLALSGGVIAAFSLGELAVAALVLWAGAAPLGAPLLLFWVTVVIYLSWKYLVRRTAWTSLRLIMSADLLERMVGHRTRLVQQPPTDWHRGEDESLDEYIARGDAMDRASVWLALAPRGWLLLGVAALVPSLAAGSTPGAMAISIGGALLAYRALQRLVGGIANLAGAIIAGRSVGPLAAAATLQEPTGVPSVATPGRDRLGARDGIVAQAHEITFRYRPEGEPVLDGCTLAIHRDAKLLLEGSSGSGKTTFASILAGLQEPDSGLLLVDGLDRAALGAEGWRRRVAMAPQAHDNYLVTGSLAFNLLMGRRWPAEAEDLSEAERVCRELGLGDLLNRLPGGMHQVVGETGWRLSQGERTRVFLARALLQHPDLLVLDESFSALDAENMERSMRCVSARSEAVLSIVHF
jgi:ATP-binding cassette subfamily B protein